MSIFHSPQKLTMPRIGFLAQASDMPNVSMLALFKAVSVLGGVVG